ncbi:sigma intracellular receptor 2-like [Anneissia japonica]|uniref:sigma intracellular receptor 2-like n=1 Tax=Anneissia japonica TaxID=1529436 RepID=UPI001425A2DE|nr:sigma intracellular receptor 2-like [Anneissia japonica]
MEYKDAMMANPPMWFKSFVFSEIFLQLPFFFLGTYAFYKGGCGWIRIPALVYASHVATTLIAILGHILFHDFSDSKYPGPETSDERLMLASFYLPYFVVPVLIILTMLFHPDYTTNKKQKAH